MGSIAVLETLDPQLMNGLLSQGVPSALLCLITWWLLSRALPAAACALERLALRHAAQLERQSGLLSEQSHKLEEIRQLLAQQLDVLCALRDSGSCREDGPVEGRIFADQHHAAQRSRRRAGN